MRVFQPSRLSLARKRRGLTQVTLARLAGLSAKAVSLFESGKLSPSTEAIESIASVTKFPTAFFYRSEVDEPTGENVSFRSLSTMTAGQRNAALAAGALAFELSAWIDQRFELPVPSLPDLRELPPPEAAMALRAAWRIGERPIGNMVHLLESQGIRVFSLAEKAKQVDAYSLWHHNLPFVFLNTVKTAEHSRMDSAHELAHLVLHRHGVPRGRDAEKDAQAFASAFLMPEGSVRAAVPRLITPSLTQLATLKSLWRVSLAALAHRLHSLGLLTDWTYRGVFVQLAKYGRHREIDGIERESSQVFAKVFGALRESGISKADAARHLDLYTNDVDALIFGLAVTPAGEGGRRVPNAAAAAARRRFKVYS